MSKVVRTNVEERRENAILESRWPRWHHKTNATRNLGSNSKVTSKLSSKLAQSNNRKRPSARAVGWLIW